MQRVDEALRAVLGEAIASEIQDPRLGFVTVTGVETSPDLRHSKVFVSVFGESAVQQESIDALEAAHGRLQSIVASQMRLKNTPELSFRLDHTAERGMRVDRLLGGEAGITEDD